MIIKSVDQILPFITNVQICWNQQNLRACNFWAKCVPNLLLARFLLPDILLIPLACTIRDGWPSLGKIKNDPNHWPKSCLWNLKLHLLGRKIVFWVWVVFVFKNHFKCWPPESYCTSLNWKTERWVNIFSKLGRGRPSFSEFVICKAAGNTSNFFFFFADFLVTLPDLTPKEKLSIFVKYCDCYSYFKNELEGWKSGGGMVYWSGW